jgi:hypothetical protein
LGVLVGSLNVVLAHADGADAAVGGGKPLAATLDARKDALVAQRAASYWPARKWASPRMSVS